MTEDDLKQIVRDVIAEGGPEIQRQQRIAAQRAEFEAYMKEVSTPRRDVAAGDFITAPVKYEETVLPVQTFTFADTGQTSGPQSSSSSSPPFAYLDAMVCNDADEDVVVRIMIQPPA